MRANPFPAAEYSVSPELPRMEEDTASADARTGPAANALTGIIRCTRDVQPVAFPAMKTFRPRFVVRVMAAAVFLSGIIPVHAQESSGPSFPDQFQEGWEKAGPNVRIKRHQDGSRTVFQRSPDDRTLVKRTFGPTGNLKMVAVYRVDGQGNPLACKIYDGKKNILFKVAYGYNKNSGRLEAERMYDARVQRLSVDNTSEETPIRIMYYNYDAQGNPTSPEVYTFNKGLRAEEVFGPNGTFPHENPFQGGR